MIGRPFPKGVSGNPRGRPPTVRRIEAALRADLGAELSVIEAVMVRTAAKLMAMSHKTDHPSRAEKCSNEARSILREIRKRRSARAFRSAADAPSLEPYLDNPPQNGSTSSHGKGNVGLAFAKGRSV
jgi:hypothetical protein